MSEGFSAIIEANQLQTVIRMGNEIHSTLSTRHQPKERKDDASVGSTLAANIRPEEITSSRYSLYTGAPTVNSRGEAR